jgi:hypothetical protein
MSGNSAILGRVTMSADALQARLVAAGLGEHAEALLGLAAPSLRLRPQPRPGGPLPLGATKLGGHPDLPAGWSWPRRWQTPLSFIAQLDLAAITPHTPLQQVLPQAGLLVFFYDADQQPWGFDPRDRDGFKVGFIAAGVPLHRAGFPADLPADGRFSEAGLVAEPQLTYAPWESVAVQQLGLSDGERLAYGQALADDQPDQVIHRLLGHPDPVQGDMQLECQLASSGIYCGDARGQHDPRAAALGAGAVQWRLLLQVDSDQDAGMLWGDVGRIYYWIRAQDLAARRLGQAWLILQCG